MSEPARDARHRLRRIPDRARYERTDLHAVLDAGFLAHVGFASAEQPFVLPMLYWRDGDDLLADLFRLADNRQMIRVNGINAQVIQAGEEAGQAHIEGPG